MAVNNDYLEYITDQLSEFGQFETKRMFGGVGFFREGKMFAMLANNVFRLKTDSSNRKDFEEKGMEPLYTSSKNKTMPYWEVPVEVLEDKHELKKWAEKSYKIAISKK
jgi:DNA transformation protein